MMKQGQENAIEKLQKQQKGVKEGSPQWCVAEQLMEICRREPDSAELIAQDLDVKEMSITEAEKKIKAYADQHKTGNFAFVSPQKAEEILREFYGLQKPGENAKMEESKDEPKREPESEIIRLEDFL